jgi:hypothetical protein
MHCLWAKIITWISVWLILLFPFFCWTVRLLSRRPRLPRKVKRYHFQVPFPGIAWRGFKRAQTHFRRLAYRYRRIRELYSSGSALLGYIPNVCMHFRHLVWRFWMPHFRKKAQEQLPGVLDAIDRLGRWQLAGGINTSYNVHTQGSDACILDTGVRHLCSQIHGYRDTASCVHSIVHYTLNLSFLLLIIVFFSLFAATIFKSHIMLC